MHSQQTVLGSDLLHPLSHITRARQPRHTLPLLHGRSVGTVMHLLAGSAWQLLHTLSIVAPQPTPLVLVSPDTYPSFGCTLVALGDLGSPRGPWRCVRPATHWAVGVCLAIVYIQ